MLKTEEINWETTTNRFVVFIDIMGFKDYVSRHSHQKVYDMMARLSATKESIESFFQQENVKTRYANKKIYTTSFSDSIILFSEDDTLQSFDLITMAACFIFGEAIPELIPLKGAMAHGMISVDKEKQIYFGQALIDAFLLQEEVNYYGIVLHNSVERHLEVIHSKPGRRYLDIKTPLKSGRINHTNLNWFYTLPIKSKAEMDIAFKNAIKNLKTITSGAPRKYIDNTEDVYNLFYPSKETSPKHEH